MSDLAKGLLITIGGVLVLTPDSLLIRLSATDPWNLIFWRGLLYGGAITAGYLMIARGGAWRAYIGIGLPGLAAAFFFSLNAFAFVLAMDHTSVANVLVLIATSPLFSAIFGLVFLKERLPLRTWTAIFACVGGVAIIALPNLGGGAFFGDAMAMLTAASLAAAFTIFRANSHIDMAPTVSLSGMATALMALAVGTVPTMDAGNAPWILVMGLFVLPVAFVAFAVGPRYLPAAQVSLILLLETVLGPVWVWVFLGEAVDPPTMLGGAIVVTALCCDSLMALRDRRRALKSVARPGGNVISGQNSGQEA
jgi:drug/metabolite transporter (DMT)-like permease